MTKRMNAALFGPAMVVGVLAAAPATAQERDSDTHGAYVAINLGATTTSDVDLTYYDEGGTFGGTGTTDTARFHADTDGAFTVGGAIGYDFGLVRTDVEVNYSRSKVKALTIRSVNGAPVTLTAADGADICDYLEADSCTVSGNSISADGSHLRQLSALANLWVDLPIGGNVVVPYAGGGVGVGGYEVDGEGKARFAFQLGAGVAFNLSPHVAITGDYRYRQINGATISDSEDDSYGTIVGKVKSSSFMAGLRFRF